MGKYLLIIVAIIVVFKSHGENIPPPYFRDVKFGSGSFFPTHLAADSAGNTYWGGSTYGAVQNVGTLVFTNQQTGFGAFFFKMGPNMDERWGKSGGAWTNQHIAGLAVDAHQNSYLAVYSISGSMVFDNVAYTSPSNHFTVVFKYSPEGNKIWSSQLDGFAVRIEARHEGLCIDSHGNVFVAGNIGQDGLGALRKLDLAGQPLWSRFWSRSFLYPESLHIQTDSEGNCLLLTDCKDRVTFGEMTLTNLAPDLSYVLVKYNPAGNEVWGNVGGGPGISRDQARDIAVDSKGNAFVLSSVGSSNSAVFLTKYNAAGSRLWSSPVRAVFDDLSAISLDRNDNVFVVITRYGWPSNTLLASFTEDGQQRWEKYVSPLDDHGFAYWASRLIDVPGVGLAVAGTAQSVALDSFVCTNEANVFTILSFGPHLSTARSGDLLTLSWPTNEVDFLLESSENVDGNAGWSTVTNAVGRQNRQNVVTNLTSGTNRFYRLRKVQP